MGGDYCNQRRDCYDGIFRCGREIELHSECKEKWEFMALEQDGLAWMENEKKHEGKGGGPE